jgi:hypothetical protein
MDFYRSLPLKRTGGDFYFIQIICRLCKPAHIFNWTWESGVPRNAHVPFYSGNSLKSMIYFLTKARNSLIGPGLVRPGRKFPDRFGAQFCRLTGTGIMALPMTVGTSPTILV